MTIRPRTTAPGDPSTGGPRPRAGTLDDARALLRDRELVVLTGAGLSTDSGIPDYRGPGAPSRRPMT